MPYGSDDGSYEISIVDEGSRSVGGSTMDDTRKSGMPSTSSTTDSGASVAPVEYVDPVVAEEEEKAVLFSRLIVMVVIIVAVASMASTIYVIISSGEKDEYETQFFNYASEMSSVARQNARITVRAIETFSSTISAYAKASNSTWPLVAIRDFQFHASNVVDLARVQDISLLPIVQEEQRAEWLNFSREMQPAVYQDAIDFEGYDATAAEWMAMTYPDIFKVDFSNFARSPEDRPGPFLVYWQGYPMAGNGAPFLNYNLLNGLRPNATFYASYNTGLPTLNFVISPIFNEDGSVQRWIPESQMMQPIFDDNNKMNKDRKIVGMIWTRVNWAAYFENLLPVDAQGIILVLESICENAGLQNVENIFTYEVNGLVATPLGDGDLHDTKYDNMKVTIPFVNLNHANGTIPPGTCIPELTLYVYPSQEFEDSFYTNTAAFYMCGVIAIFAFTSIIFGLYDFSVRRRQSKVMARIIRQDRIVSDIFPSAIRDKLYKNERKSEKGNNGFHADDGFDNDDIFGGGGPLAELYPNATVVFADIAGFTAWSSAREPPQVFELLESLYGAFDKIAYRHAVFKVETVGDCYVAVGGLPEVREDHALIVAKFARECLYRMTDLTKKLELTLGPDTGDLDLRLGIHTGQVTAGVLRGERSRFQLFGDTVNTASRMEATGMRGRIQISAATAEELERLGFSHWFKERKGSIAVKGKGNMKTYWLQSKKKSSTGLTNGSSAPSKELSPLLEQDDDYSDEGSVNEMTKTERLVEWHVEVLSHLLEQIVAARGDQQGFSLQSLKELSQIEESFRGGADGLKSTVLEEFKEIIALPHIDEATLQDRKNRSSVELNDDVVSELRHLVTVIASLYRPNPFHNFEHASHVTSSVRKLLTRIVNARSNSQSNADANKVQLVDRAGRSFGITSDPLTQFAVVFSAIIHDADHPGVPNSQLVKEGTEQARLYKKSIAEQNSVDIVWDLLMGPSYSNLRACIYTNTDELRRFRQLVVNTVMATDIVDKELQALRKSRWEKAFSEIPVDSTNVDDMNRKATIVIEHLIQASDVAHTMQHWQIYKRWNERFFMECYGAYKAHRAGGDPSIGWYKGEIGFFDFYVIPLAKKLDSCGVFGVSSHEYLNYAKSNRDEWVREGENLVRAYLEQYEEQSNGNFESTDTEELSLSLGSTRSGASLSV